MELFNKKYVEEAAAVINRMARQWSSSTLESHFDKDGDRVTSILTMKEIAGYCGVQYSTINRVIISQ